MHMFLPSVSIKKEPLRSLLHFHPPTHTHTSTSMQSNSVKLVNTTATREFLCASFCLWWMQTSKTEPNHDDVAQQAVIRVHMLLP